jgi:hypothetical protein
MLFAKGCLFLWINFFLEQKYKINSQLFSGTLAVSCIGLFVVQTNYPTTRLGNKMAAN